jgi:hypothetical protein
MISFTGGRNAVNSPSGELLLRQQQRGLKRLAPRVLDEREQGLGSEPRESAQGQDLNNLADERALLCHLLHHIRHQKEKVSDKERAKVRASPGRQANVRRVGRNAVCPSPKWA